jgi:hypothetical protein
MTVEEYAAKFIDLSHFAPHLIPDEHKKVTKFQKGLNDKIRPHILATGVNTFSETVKRQCVLKKTLNTIMVLMRVERNNGHLVLNMVRDKDRSLREGSLRSLEIDNNLLCMIRVPLLIRVRRNLALFVV